MTFAVADRVWETSTSTGVGTFYTLAGAVTGYRTFSSAFSVGTYTYYCITDGTNWEVGFGQLSASTTLFRVNVLSSSNSGSFVNFPAGTKQVFVTQPASKSILVLSDGGGGATEPPPSVSITPYWTWNYYVGCDTQDVYYGVRVANSVTLNSNNLPDIYKTFEHNTQYAYTSSAVGYTAYGFVSSPTTDSSAAANGASTHYGFYAEAVAPNAGGFRFASTTYSFFANSSIGGSNNFQFYANGTDPSLFGGPIRGSSSILSTSTSAGVGYRTGAGSTQTQSTNKSTGVTLNNICGQITMNGAALGATTSVSFTFTNSTIAATDVVIVNIASAATTNTYLLTVDAVATGSCRIHLRNISATSRSEALVLNFAVIKAVAA
jgi:hypothetical protein